MEETWDNLLQCVGLYTIDINNGAVFGELAGVMQSTKRVVETTLLLSEQFMQASPVCADVDEVSDSDKGEGKDTYDREDILVERDIKEDVEENGAEDVCKNGNAGGAEDGALEEGIRGGSINEDYEDGVKRDIGGNADGKEVRNCQGTKETVKQWTGLTLVM